MYESVIGSLISHKPADDSSQISSLRGKSVHFQNCLLNRFYSTGSWFKVSFCKWTADLMLPLCWPCHCKWVRYAHFTKLLLCTQSYVLYFDGNKYKWVRLVLFCLDYVGLDYVEATCNTTETGKLRYLICCKIITTYQKYYLYVVCKENT